MKKRTSRTIRAGRELTKDIFFIFVGASIALFLSRIGVIDGLITLLGHNEIAAFIAGMFFTSVFTIAPASVALGHIALHTQSLLVVLWGSLGAVFGDLLLFYFIRDRFSDDIMNSFGSKMIRHILASFHVGFFKWIAPVLGAAIIASPLPDEFGITLLGFSKTRTLGLIPISFLGNILGIYLIVWFGTLV
jgi:hypothetical protein